MAGSMIRLDSPGIRAMLTSSAVAAAVHQVAAAVRDDVAAATGADVVVDDYRTDRAASSVTIRDELGRTMQARDGALTRAAAGHGLEVRS